MQAQAVSWDDVSTSNSGEDERWHVALAPDEVKVVTLEQLDDLFRLSIVDSETKVWQAGMSEWQPLRVIAGIDEEPASQPTRRAHPKPPQPRPIAAQTRPAPPQARPVPPQRRPVAVAPAPAPHYPAPASQYPAPASHYPAPASFYPTAVSIAPAPTSFAAPIAPQQFNSVRPLIVSHAPYAQPRGGGFGRFLLGLAVLAGAAVSLYRNDVLREAAHSAHQDALYARLEGALGGPAFGTVRALEQSAAAPGASLAGLSAEDTLGSAANKVNSVAPSSSPSSESAASAPAAIAASPASGGTPVVALDSLAVEKKAQSAAPTSVAAVSAAPVPAPARAVAAVSVTRPTSPAKQAAPVVEKAVAAPPAAKPQKAAPAAPQKPESEMTEREKLNAAIGRSMMMSSPSDSKSKSKAKSKASEYDPLNPQL